MAKILTLTAWCNKDGQWSSLIKTWTSLQATKLKPKLNAQKKYSEDLVNDGSTDRRMESSADLTEK